MSNDIHPIQSYSIDRDSYVIRYGASKNVRDAEITTTLGVVVDRDISKELDKPEFSGKKYKYYILSHSKMLAQPEFIAGELEDSKTEEQRNAEDPENSIKWEEIMNRSLLYVTESDTLFEKYDRVFIEKKGSNLEIKGYPSYGRKAAFRDNQFIIAAESCDIQVSTVKVAIDENGNEIEIPEPQSSTSAPNGAVNNKEQEEKKQYKYKYKITSQANCAEDLTEFQELLDSYIEDTQDSQSVEFFDGWERKSTGDQKTKIPGKRYAKGRAYWNGTMQANFNIIVPLFMEKDLKNLCKKYYDEWKEPLQINSVFRSHDHQMKLYKLWTEKKRLIADKSLTLAEKRKTFYDSERISFDSINAAAKPPTSAHNYGYAIDFQITSNKTDSKYNGKSNSSFTFSDYNKAFSANVSKDVTRGTKSFNMQKAKSNWPVVFRWLMMNSSEFPFRHPPGVDGSNGLFEGWHWVYERKK